MGRKELTPRLERAKRRLIGDAGPAEADGELILVCSWSISREELLCLRLEKAVMSLIASHISKLAPDFGSAAAISHGCDKDVKILPYLDVHKFDASSLDFTLSILDFYSS